MSSRALPDGLDGSSARSTAPPDQPGPAGPFMWWSTYSPVGLDHEDDAGFNVTAQRSPRAQIGEPVAPPAGWYMDPHRRFHQRYWDGTSWTHHVTDGTDVTTDPD